MATGTELLHSLGGEEGCQRLSSDFYARVGQDPLLHSLFPGQSLRCATEEFAAFLIQFLGGDEGKTQYRWWLSLRASHARFRISPDQHNAWLTQMTAALDAAPLPEETRQALRQFFVHSASYIMGQDAAELEHQELVRRWHDQRVLDDLIAAIAAANDTLALTLAPQFGTRPSVFVGLAARMITTGRPDLIRFVIKAIQNEPALITHRYAGRTLLHDAAGAGCLEVVEALLRLDIDPDIRDRGSHTPLYTVANECALETGPRIVRTLVEAGADANACGGVTRATPLHMAARRGYVEIARALLDCGATLDAQDSKGVTPLRRALLCRRPAIVQLLRDYGASA